MAPSADGRLWQSHDSASDYAPWTFDSLAFGEVHWLRQEESDARVLLCGLWRCDPCEFDYRFLGDQTIHVIEGSATITVGQERVLAEEGTLASFQQGADSHWMIHSPFRTVFVTARHTLTDEGG